MAITVKEAYKAAETLTELERADFAVIEAYIDNKIASNFDGSTPVKVTLEKCPTTRVLKQICNVYTRNGWEVSTTSKTSDTCTLTTLTFKEHFDLRDPRD